MSYPPISSRMCRTMKAGTPPQSENGRSMLYKQYDEAALKLAVKAVFENNLSIGRAAEQFGVPKTTLHDRLKGKSTEYSHSGPRRYLSNDEEAVLVMFIKNCAEIGCGKSRSQVISVVQRVVDKKGFDVQVTGGWWDSFRRRHKDITLRSSEKLSYIRFVASSPTILDRYYDLLQATLEDNSLADKACQIYNLDESGMPLDPTPLKIACAKGTKHAQAVTTGNKKQITIMACCSASGSTIPPLVIYARKTLTPELCVGEVPGTRYGLSPNGWMDSELFEDWFKAHFLAYAPPIRPLLLLLDGHSSHFSPGFVEKAAEEQVIVFCLPPHTTHITQPLDKGCYGPLKMAWRQECQNFLTSNPGKVITIYQFSRLFHNAWDRAMTPSNVRSGFRITGIHPFDRFAGRKPPENLDFAKKNGVAFIPLFTPRKVRCVSPPSPVSPQQPTDPPSPEEPTDPPSPEEPTDSPSPEHRTNAPTCTSKNIHSYKSTLSKVLKGDMFPTHKPKYEPRSTARLLTSDEQRKKFKEKAEFKAQKLAGIAARKLQREEKAKGFLVDTIYMY